MIDIKGVNDNIILSVAISQDAVKTEELMKQYSITLSWTSITNKELPLGSYIVYDNVRYSLLEPYYPEQRDEATYEYRPVFQHPIMRLSKALMFFYTGANSRELDWTLTDNASNFMSAVCKAIKNEIGEDWTYTVASDLPASATLSFSNNDIFSALNTIAGAFETEWWFEYDTRKLHLSKAKFGNAVVLEVGNNIGVPQISKNKLSYYTRFYVFGSTRNINQNYSGAGVNSIVNRRLTLNPSKYPNGYIDVRSGLTGAEILPTALVFDDIYPRSKMTISDVRVRLMWTLDDKSQKVQIGVTEDGTPVYDQYAIWYFKIPGFTYDKADMGISGKPLSVHFNTGPLRGREFELYYHNVPYTVESSDGVIFNVEEGDYEIRFIEEGTYIIPAITGLTPVDGNSVTLFNIDMPEEYKLSAYNELESAALNAIEKRSNDYDNYSFDSNKVAFYESNPNLAVGRSVTYINGSQRLNTRVIKLETKLDHPFEQNITIGNAQIKGTQQTLKEEVFSANQNIDLLSAINENTTAFQQALQRTQKAVLESIAKYGDWLGLDENYDLYVREKRIWTINEEGEEVEEIVPRNFWVSGEVSAGGIGQPSEGGGEGDVGFGVVLDAAKLGTIATEDLSQTFSAYAIDSIYKKLIGVEQGLGAKTLGELSNVDIAANAINSESEELLVKGIGENSWKVRKLSEIALNENKLGEYLTAKGYITKTTADEAYAALTAFNTLNASFNTLLQGYFDKDGNANNALKLGGQLPSYYATSESVSTFNSRIKFIEDWFELKDDVLRTKYHLASDGEVSSGGIGEPSTDDSFFNLLTSWNQDYDETYALGANLGVELKDITTQLNSRIATLERNPSFDANALWVELTKADASKVIDASHIPALSWSKITSGKPTSLSGYGITDAYTKTETDAKYVTLDTAQYISGTKVFSNGLNIGTNKWMNFYTTAGSAITFMQLSETAKIFYLGFGFLEEEINTYIYGNNIYFRYGKNGSIAMTITSSGSININTGLTCIAGKTLDWSGNIWSNTIYPKNNLTYNLGSSSYRWKDAYINQLKIGDAVIYWDSENQCLRTDKSFSSDGELSSGGIGEPSTDDSVFNLLTSWNQDYNETYALGANLGVELKDITTQLNSRIATLEQNPSFDANALWTELAKSDASKVIHSSHIPDLSSNYVTLDTIQTITGAKSFTGHITIANGKQLRFYDNSDSPTPKNIIQVDSANDVFINYGLRDYNTVIYGNNIKIRAGGTSEVMRIASSGNVLIGTTTDNAAYKLNVNGNVYAKSFVGTADNASKLNGQEASYYAVATNVYSKAESDEKYLTSTNLSNYTGSAKITTVGTITSGTWQGTKIANGYLANSSVTISGKAVSLGGTITQSDLRNGLGLGSLAYKSSLVAGDIPSLDWSKITSGKPTSLSGYGIADAYTKTETDAKYVTLDTAQFISGTKVFSNGLNIGTNKWMNFYTTAGAAITFMQLNENSKAFNFGYGFSAEEINTSIYGNNIYFRYGKNGGIAMTITSSGDVNLDNSLIVNEGSGNARLFVNKVTASPDYAHIYVSNAAGTDKHRPLVLQYGYGKVLIGTDTASGDALLQVNGSVSASSATLSSTLTVTGNVSLGGALSGAEDKTLDWYGNIWSDNIYPQDDSQYSLGSSAYKWQAAYINLVTATEVTASAITVTSNINLKSGVLLLGDPASVGYTNHIGFNTYNGITLTSDYGVKIVGGTNPTLKIGDAVIYWDSENQCLRTDKSFSSDGELSSGGIGEEETDGYLSVLGGNIGSADNTGKTLGLYGYLQFWRNSTPANGVRMYIDSADGLAVYSSNASDIAEGISDGYAKFRVWGNIFAGATSNGGGYITCTQLSQSSDIRYKNKIEDIILSSEVIANAPMFRFTWQDRNDGKVFIGTSAQYWVEHAQELTVLVDDKYTLDYATLGVLMGKSNATEIEKLKAEVKELRTKVENYEKMLNAN